jgi:hypothetical protein
MDRVVDTGVLNICCRMVALLQLDKRVQTMLSGSNIAFMVTQRMYSLPRRKTFTALCSCFSLPSLECLIQV